MKRTTFRLAVVIDGFFGKQRIEFQPYGVENFLNGTACEAVDENATITEFTNGHAGPFVVVSRTASEPRIPPSALRFFKS